MTAQTYRWPPHPQGALLFYQCWCGQEWLSRQPDDESERDLRAHVETCQSAVNIHAHHEVGGDLGIVTDDRYTIHPTAPDTESHGFSYPQVWP